MQPKVGHLGLGCFAGAHMAHTGRDRHKATCSRGACTPLTAPEAYATRTRLSLLQQRSDSGHALLQQVRRWTCTFAAGQTVDSLLQQRSDSGHALRTQAETGVGACTYLMMSSWDTTLEIWPCKSNKAMRCTTRPGMPALLR